MRYCVNCGVQGGQGGFREEPDGDTRSICRTCENARKRERRRAASPPSPIPPAATPPEAHPTATGAETYVVLSDIHEPYSDPRAIDIVCDVLADLRPHGLILNGDIADLPEVSRHNAGSVAHLEGKRITETFESTRRLVSRLTVAAGPRCTKKHFVFGNHEDRLRRWLNSGDNAVWAGDEGLDLRIRFGLAENGYIVHDDYPEAHVRIGKLLVTHGQYCGKYPAARHMERYQTSVLVGHTHTVQSYTASTWDGQRAAYCQGYLADPDSEAMAYAPLPKNWQTGFSVVYVAPDGRFWVQFLNIVGGELYYGGRAYPKARAA